jgi:hypothetical protein
MLSSSMPPSFNAFDFDTESVLSRQGTAGRRSVVEWF